ncbi:hypothetical protein PVAG01_04431 [Phlyctema vagabunda]|uniref:Uncharacterized protein n=1 Tax=Phlyctema vagabunda TaxID=108571 RepID=A0ABR4PPD8_9HELO
MDAAEIFEREVEKRGDLKGITYLYFPCKGSKCTALVTALGTRTALNLDELKYTKHEARLAVCAKALPAILIIPLLPAATTSSSLDVRTYYQQVSEAEAAAKAKAKTAVASAAAYYASKGMSLQLVPMQAQSPLSHTATASTSISTFERSFLEQG